MGSKVDQKNCDDHVPTEKKLDDLYALIEDIGVAMMTTRRPDGDLVSRPMQTQKQRIGEADIWFVTSDETHKLDELVSDPHVNLGYMQKHGGDWVSVSGVARVSKDRDLIRRVYSKDSRAWFGDDGGERNGGPDDPRISLILVDAHSAMYLKQTHSNPSVLFQVARGAVIGEPPKTGDLRYVSRPEMQQRPHS